MQDLCDLLEDSNYFLAPAILVLLSGNAHVG